MISWASYSLLAYFFYSKVVVCFGYIMKYLINDFILESEHKITVRLNVLKK